MKILFVSTGLLLSGCAAFTPEPALDPYTYVEESASFKETSIIKELNTSGCDISRFETMTSPRKNVISVYCK